MATPFTAITYADFKAIADLANSKGIPLSPFSFPPFAGKDTIAMPATIDATADYTTGTIPDGTKLTLWLYGYKTIAGVKTYVWDKSIKVFKGKTGSGTFSVTWSWINPAVNTPDGYIAIIPVLVGQGYINFWQDLGLVTSLTVPDFIFVPPTWHADNTYEWLGADNTPCAHGIWLKTFNWIRRCFIFDLSLFGGSVPFNDTFLVSGPWCISQGEQCHLYINGQSVYKDLKFLYSEADSTTGNELSSETTMGTYFPANTGANDLNFSVNGTITGRVLLLSDPPGQNASDWALSCSESIGVTISFDHNFNDTDFPPSGRTVTAMIFDFAETPYNTGTPLTVTATPSAGGGIIAGGTGGKVNAVYLSEITTYATTDVDIIHPAGKAGKSVALASSLPAIVFTGPTSATINFPAHYRATVNGVFVAMTLPTHGINPYIDIDLPQYSPNPNADEASSRRIALDNSQPYIATIDNRGALWPVFRDTDFTPDSFFDAPLLGSKAWQGSIYTKYITTRSRQYEIHPSGAGNNLKKDSIFVPAGSVDLRILSPSPSTTVYVRANDFPTVTTFDAVGSGGAWLSVASQDPSFPTDTTWFYGFYNPTADTITETAEVVVVGSNTAPNGTFFNTALDLDGNAYGLIEGYTYNFVPDDDSTDQRPTPLAGYSVFALTVSRVPVPNEAGINVTPSTGTSALDVDIGVMAGFGWATAGTFQKMQTVTIPAGQGSITVAVFWVCLAGAPLAYQCPQSVLIRAACNFQPMLHSQYLEQTTETEVGATAIGYYDGEAYYNTEHAWLTFRGGFVLKPILLPVAAVCLTDLTDCLSLLP